jgi:SAM-dependent methyltransferase
MLAAGRAGAQGAGLAVELVEGNLADLPVADAAFDVVAAVTVLCFMSDAERTVCEMATLPEPGGRMAIGELGRWNLWAAKWRISGLGPCVERRRLRTAGQLRRLMTNAGLAVTTSRGAILYPPCAAATALLAPCDSWPGRRTTIGAAFLAVAGVADLAMNLGNL